MQNLSFIAIASFFGLFLVSRLVTNAAAKKLTDEERLRLYDALSSRNSGYLVIVVVLAIAYFGGITYFPDFSRILTVIYLIVFGAYLAAKFLVNLKKLKQIQLPQEYIKSFVIGYSIFVLGFVVLGAISLFILSFK